jgi:hypothetical protein
MNMIFFLYLLHEGTGCRLSPGLAWASALAQPQFNNGRITNPALKLKLPLVHQFDEMHGHKPGPGARIKVLESVTVHSSLKG